MLKYKIPLEFDIVAAFIAFPNQRNGILKIQSEKDSLPQAT